MRFSVLGVGTELTTGQISNTNAQWISKRIQEFGAVMTSHMTVPDERSLIVTALNNLAALSDVIFVTGGLGPTSDDFTRELISEWSGAELVYHPEQYDRLLKLLATRNLKPKEGHKQECFFPKGALILNNPVGTANGFLLKAKGKDVVVLPGPPKEIEGIWFQDLQAPLKAWMKDIDPLITASWDCMGLPESEVAAMVEPLLVGCPFEKAFRVHLPYIEFKLTYHRSKSEQATPYLQALTAALMPYTGGDLFSTGQAQVAPENILYFDYCATTPCEPQVLEAMAPYHNRRFGNSINTLNPMGLQAEKAVETSRKTIAGILNCKASELVFTSGSTESNNLALRGTLDYWFKKDPSTPIHFITANTEHKSVLATVQKLQEVFPRFLEYDVLRVQKDGRVLASDLAAKIKPNTKLVTLMWVNNEMGAIHPIHEIAQICQAKGIPLHVDGTQAPGKVKVDFAETPVSMMSMSGHKIYGPKGVGLFFTRQKTPFLPIQLGALHERGLRAGTVNVPGVVGLAKAFELVQRNGPADIEKAKSHRRFLLEGLKAAGIPFRVNGNFEADESSAVPQILNLSFQTEKLLQLPGVAFSRGSACGSDQPEVSHVFQALGLNLKEADRTFRISLGRGTTMLDCEKLLQIIKTDAG
jgi:cysteine desulfurase